MTPNKIYSVTFSPNQSTKRIALNILQGLGLTKTPIELLDQTRVSAREKQHRFASGDLLVAAVPTFGGRLPPVLPQLFGNIEGDDTSAILAIVYGNQAFGDALLEMKDLLEQRGFHCVAAGAFVAQHALSTVVAHGRPGQDDLGMARELGKRACAKLEADDRTPISVPGDRPYRAFPGFPYPGPATDASCTLCMACHKWCPMDAIPYYQPNETDYSKCVRCQSCVHRCPIGARAMTDPGFLTKIEGFNQRFGDVRSVSELFL